MDSITDICIAYTIEEPINQPQYDSSDVCNGKKLDPVTFMMVLSLAITDINTIKQTLNKSINHSEIALTSGNGKKLDPVTFIRMLWIV